MEITGSLILAAILFSIGILGVLIRRNILVIFMSVEIMLNAVNLTFVAFSRLHGHMDGHVFVFFIIALAAAEAGVGLAIVISIFRNRESVDVEHLKLMKW